MLGANHPLVPPKASRPPRFLRSSSTLVHSTGVGRSLGSGARPNQAPDCQRSPVVGRHPGRARRALRVSPAVDFTIPRSPLIATYFRPCRAVHEAPPPAQAHAQWSMGDDWPQTSRVDGCAVRGIVESAGTSWHTARAMSLLPLSRSPGHCFVRPLRIIVAPTHGGNPGTSRTPTHPPPATPFLHPSPYRVTCGRRR